MPLCVVAATTPGGEWVGGLVAIVAMVVTAAAVVVVGISSKNRNSNLSA